MFRPLRMSRLVSLAVLLAVAMTAGADLRTELGSAKVRAVEAAFAAAAPTAKLTWTDTLNVELPSGAKSEVSLLGPEVEVTPDGVTTYVMQVEFDDLLAAVVKHHREFTTTPPPAEPTDFVAVVKLSGTGEVLGQKIGRLDPTAVAIEAKGLELVEEYDVPQNWPGVSVTYWGYYGTTDWFGAVRWEAVYDFQLMTYNSRTPLGIAKARATGEGVEEHVLAVRTSPEIVSIRGGVTEQVVPYPCPNPCLFDGKSLLAAWGASTAVVATR
jgi:hypothetical protein